MMIRNSHDMIGKQVVDVDGTTIGIIDKTWKSWNEEYPGWFFGVKPNESTRDTWFRGTTKLIPIYSDYIRETTGNITLNRTAEQLSHFWNKAVPCGDTTHPIDQLTDMPIYDKNHSRVGTFYGWVESDGTYKQYGCFVDPYLCDTWNLPHNAIMPLPPNYFYQVTDTITLDKTLDELRDYWQKEYRFK